jgi:type II secretory pathway pseudopilin PulG
MPPFSQHHSECDQSPSASRLQETATRPLACAAFTIIELLVCMGIIATLLGLGLPALISTRKRADINGSKALVHAVATAIEQYSQRLWTVSYDHDGDDADGDGMKDSSPSVAATPPRQRSGRIFDCNSTATDEMGGDGYLDGFPGLTADATHDGPFWSETIRSGYGGFLAMTHMPVADRFIKEGRLVDAWKHPLKIQWSAERFGPSGFGVWSTGRDGIDDTADDICSWKDDK